VTEVQRAARWAFEHFYHADKANATMHTAEVRFSPITFRLAEALSERLHDTEWPQGLYEVMAARGQYEEDPGR
jgi:hypothetical protein